MKTIPQLKRIYIDPGHVGKSFFDFRHFTLEEIEFHEGDFCFAWADILQKSLLEKVEMTGLSRNKGQPSFLISAKENQLRQNELISSMGTEAALKKFRVPRAFFPSSSTEELLEAAVQNEADLLNRSKVANEQKYDLCLSLHLNGDPKNLKTAKNGICGFTNQTSKDYFPLFETIIQNIALLTDLPVIQVEELEEVKKGIFVDESLTLLRNISIPTLLIEGPFQNNPIELMLLNQSLTDFQNSKAVNGRLEQLTKAIVCSF